MIVNADAIQWAKDYEGDPFHAIICDPPYHLTTITKRFGKENSAPAQDTRGGGPYARTSKGFMGQTWDGGDIAFQPETWKAFFDILFPGAFGMAFGGSRTAHRMAVAIEDAGFIIHPMIFWAYGSGFPKATRIKDEEAWQSHRYGLQALKPAGEPIIVFQKPYQGRPLDNITESGAGALNIDGGRIGHSEEIKPMKAQPGGNNVYKQSGRFEATTELKPSGRWPANFILTHAPECLLVGYKDSDSYQINRFTDGAKPFGDGAGHEFESEEIPGGQFPVWECVDGCPAQALGEEARFFHQSSWDLEASDPFIYQAKASVNERNAGLNNLDEVRSPGYGYNHGLGEAGEGMFKDRETKKRNTHPTLKPINLIKHLATLLLPPSEYSPRRIVVPFAGVGSEVIGCWQAGWDEITGIELKKEYAEIGMARLEHWKSLGIQLNLFKGKP